MAPLKELKTQFLEYIEIERGRAIKTVENYDQFLPLSTITFPFIF